MSDGDRKFILRAIMFADGAKGAASQEHEILEGDIDKGEKGRPTGITYVWSRKDGRDPGKRTFFFNGAPFETFAEALAASDSAKQERTAG